MYCLIIYYFSTVEEELESYLFSLYMLVYLYKQYNFQQYLEYFWIETLDFTASIQVPQRMYFYEVLQVGYLFTDTSLYIFLHLFLQDQ